VDLAAQAGVGEVVAGEDRAHGAAEFLKCLIGGVAGSSAPSLERYTRVGVDAVADLVAARDPAAATDDPRIDAEETEQFRMDEPSLLA
jgi:hypothetical protein